METLLKAADDMGLNEKQIQALLRLRIPSSKWKAATRQVLHNQDASSVVGLLKLIGQVEVMVEESGISRDFVAARWLARWMDTPNPALGGKLPSHFMYLHEGQQLLSGLLAQTQSGAYA